MATNYTAPKLLTINDLLQHYRVTKYKETKEGLIAIKKGGYWLYFRYVDEKNGYFQTGSTLRFCK